MARCTWVVLAGLAVALCACDVASEDELGPGDGSDYAGSSGSDPDEDDDAGGTEDDEAGSGGDSDEPGSGSDEPASDPPGPVMTLSTGCAPYGAGAYTPFKNYGPVSTGTVATYPWRGPQSYPDTIEDFRAYGPTLPEQVECGNDRTARDHLDVTSGCLTAVSAFGQKAGQIQGTSSGYYRSFALPHDPTSGRQVAWADQGVEYRFNYSTWTGDISGPGFKAFVRYMTEYDLYVASWRRDGVVQIQKKQCGVYSVLKRDNTYGAPSPNTWHTIRFQIVGNEMRLYLDGKLAMTATDASIKHGTAGIRIDSADGAYIDDWRAYAP